MATEVKTSELLRPATRSRAIGLALAAGLLAGLAAWAVGEAFVDRFGIPPHLIGKMGADAEVMRLTAAAAVRRAAVAATALGSALGLALGLAGGLTRRSARAGLLAAALGAIEGAGAGLGASLALLPFFDRLRIQIADNLLIPFLLHGGITGAIGAAGGLAYACGLGLRGTSGLLRLLLGGLAGALIGTAASEVIGAIVMPGSGTSQPIATAWAARLLAALAPAVGASAAAACAGIGDPRPRA